MTVKIFDTPEVQTFLNAVAGLDQAAPSRLSIVWSATCSS